MPNFALGWKRQIKATPRNRMFVHVPANNPPSVDLTPGMGPLLNQGNLGTCGLFTATECLTYDQIAQGITPPQQASELFLYYWVRQMMGTFPQDSGVDNATLMQSMAKYGTIPLSMWPYDDTALAVVPTAAMNKVGLANLVTQYAGVIQDLAQMQATLANLPGDSARPFIFGFNVFQQIMSDQAAANGILTSPAASDSSIGGHDVTICFTGDTKVPLLDGTERTLRDLADGVAGLSFWVYSCDGEGNVVPGLAHSPRKTRRNAELLKVTLDNGETIRCTPDHPFMMRDGSYRQASLLQSGDSLMPLYRKLGTGQMKGYERVYNPATKRWRFTHRVSAAYAHGGRYDGEVVHHKDFDKRNNAPDNLEVMSWDDHTRLHSEHCDLLNAYAQSEEGRQQSRQIMEEHWADPEWRARMIEQLGKNGRAACNTRAAEGRNGTQTWTEEDFAAAHAKMAKTLTGRPRSEEACANISSGLKKLYAEDPEALERCQERQKKATEAAAQQQKRGLTQAQLEARRESIKKARAARRNNHKVVSVESAGCEDVYDLTVEAHHNFALSAGVFVHNCGYNASSSPLPGVMPGNSFPPGYFKFRNHWFNDATTPWGDGGYGYIPFDYATGPQASDFYVINVAPNSGAPTPGPTPTPVPVPPSPTPTPVAPLFWLDIKPPEKAGSWLKFRLPVAAGGFYFVTAGTPPAGTKPAATAKTKAKE